MNGGDAVLDALTRMAGDAFSYMQSRGMSAWSASPPDIAEHPASPDFEEAVASDPLGDLFPDGLQGWVALSNGAGQLVHKEALAWGLLGSAAWRLLATSETFDLEAYKAAVATHLDQARQLVIGQEADLVALLVFAGIKVAPDGSVELPWGRLRPTTPFVNALTSWSAGDFALETNVRVRALVTTPGADPPMLDSAAVVRRLDEAEAKTILTLLLGLENGKPAAVRMWRTIITPFQAVGYSTEGGALRPLFGTQAFLDADNAQRLLPVAATVDQEYERKLDVAVRRVVSSVTARLDPADGLIDAVIALESLFAGTDKSELRFRIAAATAWLLEPDDAAARNGLFKDVRGLYDTRSRIVHGQAHVSKANVQRDRAFEIAVRSLRRLYNDFPTLLNDDQRSSRLILHTA